MMEYAVHRTSGMPAQGKRLVGVSQINYEDGRMDDALHEGIVLKLFKGKDVAWWPKLAKLTRAEEQIVRSAVTGYVSFACAQRVRQTYGAL